MLRTESSFARAFAVSAIVGVIAAPAHAQRIVAKIPVAGLPVGLGLSGDQSFLYVCNLGTDLVQVIDINKRQVVDAIRTGDGPIWIAMRPNSTEAYVANSRADTVAVIDTATRTVLKQIQVEHGPHNVVFSPDGSLAYVAIFGENDGAGVDVIDADSRTFVDSIQ